MTVLNALYLPLVSNHGHKDQDTFAGRVCNVALQYISRSARLVACYVSKDASNNDMWLFLVHQDIQSCKHFVESTIGAGIMMPFLQSPPRLYSFPEGTCLDRLCDWTNPWSVQLSIYDFDPKPSAADMAKFEQAIANLWKPLKIIFTQHSSEDSASVLGLTMEAKSLLSVARNHSIDAPQYTVQSHIVGVDQFVAKRIPDSISLLPTTTGDLLSSDPRCYGDVSFDESEIGLTAQAEAISFRPMEYISSSDWFSRDENDFSCRYPHDKCLSITTVHFAQERCDENLTHVRAICREFSKQPGLLSLSWCSDEHDSRVVRFVAAWRHPSDYKLFSINVTKSDISLLYRKDIVVESETHDFPIQAPPAWDDASTLELTTFNFPTPLSQYEQTAFDWYLNKFIANMESSDPDDSSVAQPFSPIWSSERPRQQCILLVSWTGRAQREAWLRNFLAHRYDVAGYLAHGVSLAGATVGSLTGVVRVVDYIELKYAEE